MKIWCGKHTFLACARGGTYFRLSLVSAEKSQMGRSALKTKSLFVRGKSNSTKIICPGASALSVYSLSCYLSYRGVSGAKQNPLKSDLDMVQNRMLTLSLLFKIICMQFEFKWSCRCMLSDHKCAEQRDRLWYLIAIYRARVQEEPELVNDACHCHK